MTDPAPLPTLTLDALITHLERPRSAGRDWRVTVRVANPGGLSAHQTVDAVAIFNGFDWEAGQMVIHTAKPLTWLTPDQLVELSESAAKGQSWHAYQAHKRYAAEIKALKERIAVLEAQNPTQATGAAR